MSTKRKSFAKALEDKMEGPETPQGGTKGDTDPKTPKAPETAQDGPQGQPDQQPIKFNKFTFPLREDLHRQLSKTVARLNLERDVEASMAILIRLGIEHVLDRLEKNPDALLKNLYKLEQKEVFLSGDKKYTVNRGLAEYVQRLTQK